MRVRSLPILRGVWAIESGRRGIGDVAIIAPYPSWSGVAAPMKLLGQAGSSMPTCGKRSRQVPFTTGPWSRREHGQDSTPAAAWQWGLLLIAGEGLDPKAARARGISIGFGGSGAGKPSGLSVEASRLPRKPRAATDPEHGSTAQQRRMPGSLTRAWLPGSRRVSRHVKFATREPVRLRSRPPDLGAPRPTKDQQCYNSYYSSGRRRLA